MKIKLKNIGNIVTGKTPSTSNNENFNGDIPFITPQDVSKGYIIHTTNRMISQKGYNSIIKNTINGISILVNCIGNIGDVAISKQKAATNQQINAITNIKKEFDYMYIYYKLCTMKSVFQKLAGQTVLSILPKSIFNEIEIEIPNIVMQKKISNLLARIDDKIENNNKINIQLEKMAKILYDYWFLQFEFPNEEGKPYKSSGGKMVWNEQLKKEIPKNWTVQRINSIAKLLAGGDKPKEFSSVKNNKYKVPIYCNSNENRGLYGYTIEPTIKQNSITVTARGNVGYAILRTMPYIPIIRLISVIPNEDNYLKYLELYINSYNFYKNVSIQQQLTIPQLETLKILCPEDMILNKFENLMTKSVKIIEKNLEENEELIKLRDYLLPLLMNGQVNFK